MTIKAEDSLQDNSDHCNIINTDCGDGSGNWKQQTTTAPQRTIKQAKRRGVIPANQTTKFDWGGQTSTRIRSR